MVVTAWVVSALAELRPHRGALGAQPRAQGAAAGLGLGLPGDG